jgi:hypothetical protein
MRSNSAPSQEKMAVKVLARIAFHACDTLVFIRPDGAIDSTPAFSARAAALNDDQAVRRAGYKLVGVYRPGVSLAQLLADVMECAA